MAKHIKEITLTHVQTNALRRSFAAYGGSELPTGGGEKEKTDAFFASLLQKTSPESVRAIQRLANHDIPAVVIHGLPLGYLPYNNSMQSDDAVDRGLSISSEILSSLAGATGRKTEDCPPMVILNPPYYGEKVLPDKVHRDRHDFTILLCTRGNYHTITQLAESGGKTPQHQAKTAFYLLDDAVHQPEMKKEGRSFLGRNSYLPDLMAKDSFCADNEKGPLITRSINGKHYLLNNKFYRNGNAKPINDKAYYALKAFENALSHMKPSFEVELKRGDAIIFDQAHVVSHVRSHFIAHADPAECRRLESRLCMDEPVGPFTEKALADARIRLMDDAKPSIFTGR